MTNATLTAMREISRAQAGVSQWEWIGPNSWQRMFGITEQRAKGYAERHGGTARKMHDEDYDDLCERIENERLDRMMQVECRGW